LDPEQTEALARAWLSIRRRTAAMKFNKKNDEFVRAQREIRTIFHALLRRTNRRSVQS
jgi:hypothetical protein